MKCKQAHKLLHLYAENHLAEQDASQVKAHLDGCELCSHRLNALAMVYSHIEDDLKGYTHNNFLAAKVWTRLNDHSAPRLGSLPPVKSLAISIAAAAGIMLGVVLGGAMQQRVEWSQRSEQQSQQLWAEYFPEESPFNPYENID